MGSEARHLLEEPDQFRLRLRLKGEGPEVRVPRQLRDPAHHVEVVLGVVLLGGALGPYHGEEYVHESAVHGAPLQTVLMDRE